MDINKNNEKIQLAEITLNIIGRLVYIGSRYCYLFTQTSHLREFYDALEDFDLLSLICYYHPEGFGDHRHQ